MELYNLQQALTSVEPGIFMNGLGIKSFGNTPPAIYAEIHGDGKRLHVTGRRERDDGISILLPEMNDLLPGDRLTIKGYAHDDTRSTNTWGMCLRSPRGEFNQVAQVIAPKGSFTITYVIDKTDLPYPLHIHTNAWDGETPDMDFFIEDITIFRDETANVRTDRRQLIYSMETDNFMRSYRSGDIFARDPDNPIAPAGQPTCVIKRQGSSNAIYVVNRKQDWEGLDIKLNLLGLMPGNSYNIHVIGRIEGIAPPDTQIMFQILPGYAWRDNHVVYSHKDFTLGHTLTLMELESADALRIATNAPGAKVDFSISNIEVTTEEWEPFVF